MRFSLFDWLDESGRGYADTYDERLKYARIAEEEGFYAYYLAEHHGTSLSTTPSPSLFLSAVAQHTTRLRMGALTWVLPIYNPLRLLEELCMLDQMSRGRIDIGVGAGSSPHEVGRHGVAGDEARGRFNEALEIIIRGFTTGEIDYAGKYFQFNKLKTRFQPYQKPYAPLWYPTSKVESIPRLAAQGYNTVMSLMHSPSFEVLCESLALYRKEVALHRHDAGRLNAHVAEPEIAFTTHVYVAATDELAREQAGAAYAQFHENFTRRYVDLGQGDKYAHRADFGKLVREGKLLCGSPDTVRKALESMIPAAGVNHFIGAFTFGSLTFDQTRSSLELFAREVMPAFQ
jgi:alkanesulfonate monooxygenase SsuD/methylene tetrahydromethanopterin reductase-like flavin-dependent oxidoreductase (luciferase family)